MTKEGNGEQQNSEEKTGETENEADNAEATDNEQETVESGGFGSFFSPEAVLMLPLAVFLDLIGLVLIIFLLDDFFVTDIIGIVMIGGWTYFRSRQVQMTQGAQQKLGKAAKRLRRLKWLRPLLMLGELIPFVGALPCWTILVYLELKN